MKREIVDDIGLKVREIIKKNLDSSNPPENIELTSRISELVINSLTFIKIIVSTEVEFGIEFGDEDLDINNYACVQALVDYVVQKRSNLGLVQD